MIRLFKKLLLPACYAVVIGLPLLIIGSITIIEVAVHRAELPSAAGRPIVGTPTYLDVRGDVLAQLAGEQARLHLPVQLDQMGDWLPATTIALEDHRFRDHNGVDWYAIAAAAARNLRRPDTISGASTISQQVIKQADRRQGRKLKAKVREAILALKLERGWDKDTILATYLNRLDYGNRRVGPESAAMAYFGKRAKRLTQPEAIYLAGLPQSPSRFNPWRHPERALAKYERSLQRLLLLEIIDQQQHDTFKQNPPEVLRRAPENLAPMFLIAALDGKAPRAGRHHTTLDLQLQQQAQRVLNEQLDSINRDDVRNAAIVVIDNATGAVRALASAARGGSDVGSEINGATIPRHAGSTLKPFVYLMGIDEKKLTAATVFPDTQDAVTNHYADYDPHNFSRGYRGPVRLREALANSLNIPAVLALEKIGARRCFFELEEWGLHEEEKFEELGAGFVLGNLRVSLVDLTAAYAGLARGGLAAPAQFWADVPPAAQHRLATAEATKIVEDILCDNQARSLAFGSNSPLDLGWRAAVKTGTSSSFRDAWTVGYCRDYTVGVWVGNFDGQSMSGTLAVQTATPVWRRMMLHLKNHRAARPLEAPQPGRRLVAAQIDPLSGLQPTVAGQREWFLPDTAPTESASSWSAPDSGKPLLPAEYAKWVASKHNHLGATLQPPADGGDVLKILSPGDGRTYVIDQDLPVSQQSLELRALAESESIEWRVNGELHDGAYWQLAPGEWQITARTEGGAEARVAFSVE